MALVPRVRSANQVFGRAIRNIKVARSLAPSVPVGGQSAVESGTSSVSRHNVAASVSSRHFSSSTRGTASSARVAEAGSTNESHHNHNGITSESGTANSNHNESESASTNSEHLTWKERETRLDILLEEARMAFSEREYDRALRANNDIVELIEKAPKEKGSKRKSSFKNVQWLKLCAAKINSAFVLKVLCRFPEAAASVEEGVKLLDKHYSGHKQQTAEALELLGEILLLEGERVEEAEEAVNRAIDIKKSVLGHPAGFHKPARALATPSNLLGRVCEKQGKLDKALAQYVTAFDHGFTPGEEDKVYEGNNETPAESAGSNDSDNDSLPESNYRVRPPTVPPPVACASLSNYAGVLQTQERYLEAIGIYEKTIEYLAQTLKRSYEEALTRVAKPKRISLRTQHSLGSQNLNVARATAEMALAYKSEGMKAQCTLYLQQALVVHATTLGLAHPMTETLIATLQEVAKTEESKTDADQKREVIEKGIGFVEKLVKEQREYLRRTYAVKGGDGNSSSSSTVNVSGDTAYIDSAGHVGHGPQGDNQRLRAERHYYPDKQEEQK